MRCPPYRSFPANGQKKTAFRNCRAIDHGNGEEAINARLLAVSPAGEMAVVCAIASTRLRNVPKEQLTQIDPSAGFLVCAVHVWLCLLPACPPFAVILAQCRSWVRQVKTPQLRQSKIPRQHHGCSHSVWSDCQLLEQSLQHRAASPTGTLQPESPPWREAGGASPAEAVTAASSMPAHSSLP